MSLENAQYVYQLDPANPSGSDKLKDGDDHIRMIKAALRATFPGLKGPLNANVTDAFLNGLVLAAMPTGGIILWTGTEAAVPAGWAICDGRRVSSSSGSGTVTTPDLRDRVPVGVTSTAPVGTLAGQYGKTYTSTASGSHSHVATEQPAGAHTHGGVTGDHVLTSDEMPAHRHLSVVSVNSSGQPIAATNSTIAIANLGGDSAYGLAGISQEPNVGLTSAAGSSKAHGHPISSDGSHTHAIQLDTAPGHTHGVTIDTSQPSYAVYYLMKV